MNSSYPFTKIVFISAIHTSSIKKFVIRGRNVQDGNVQDESESENDV